MTTSSKRGGGAAGLGTVGLLLLPVVCCGVPFLIAAGVLGAVGSVAGSPWVIAAAAAAVAGVIVALLRRQGRRHGQVDDCCVPGTAAAVPDTSDRAQTLQP